VQTGLIGRFARQARISTPVVGLTGFYMVYRFDLWDRFRSSAYWWMEKGRQLRPTPHPSQR
jgi:hypothetical protein